MRNALFNCLIVLVLLVFQCPDTVLCIGELPTPLSRQLLSVRNLLNSTTEAGQSCSTVSTLTNGTDACAYVRANCEEGGAYTHCELQLCLSGAYTCSQAVLCARTCISCQLTTCTVCRLCCAIHPPLLLLCAARGPAGCYLLPGTNTVWLSCTSLCCLQAHTPWLHLALSHRQCCTQTLALVAYGAPSLLIKYNHRTADTRRGLAQVACVLWLLLLFRVLGSTAEDFFSPILTQLAQDLSLPPRLAGGACSWGLRTACIWAQNAHGKHLAAPARIGALLGSGLEAC